MAKKDDNQPGFMFKKLLIAKNYKEWECQICYSLKLVRL